MEQNEKKKTSDTKPTRFKIKELPKTAQINNFFKKNNYIISLSLVLMVILTMCDNRSYKKETIQILKEESKYLRDNIQTIGFVSATGQILTIDRKPIDYNSEVIKEAIVNTTIEPFLQGGEEIRNGKDKVFSSTEDMVRKNQKFNYFYKNILPNGDVAKSIFDGIFQTVSTLYYPEYITVLKEDIVNFGASQDLEDKNKKIFSFSVVLKLKTKSWIVQLNKWADQELTITINAKGEIYNSKYANSSNLLGFKITHINVPLIQKPDISVLRQQ